MQDKRKMLHKILDLVIDINGFEERQKEYTGDKPTVFFNFTGHVCWAELRVYEHGWGSGKKADFEFQIDLNKESNFQPIINYLKGVKDRYYGKSTWI